MGQRLGRTGGSLLAWAAALTLIGGAALATAQESPAPEAKSEAVAPLAGEVRPSVHYLPDKDGHLQAVPGFTLEEFTELFKLKNQLAQQNQQPSFSIEKLSLGGMADGRKAELTAQFTVTVHEAGWVGVPLRLNDAMLLESAGYEGGGEHFLHFEPDRRGYIIWIRDEPGKTHQVTLKLLAPLTHVGPEAHLQLSLPRAAIAQLRLEVPFDRAVASVSDGGTLESTRSLGGGKSELAVVGIGGELDVAWHAADALVANLPTVLEATGVVQVRITGRSVNSDARLNVRSLGGEFDRFQVRLPPGAEYVGTVQPGMSVAVVDATAAQGKLYEVKLEKKTSGPVEVRLVSERSRNTPQADETLDLAGFEVKGAVRQWGTVAVEVEGNWQIVWGETNHVQVDELGGSLPRDSRTAAFEYFVQPYSLPARVMPQKTRVRVEPEYVLLVGGEEAQLRARLKYTIRGAKIRSLELDLPDWEIDAVGPDTLVDVDAAATSQTRPFVIPLLHPTSGELELTLEARRKIAPGAARVSLELPSPRGEAIAPANVVVLPADNVALTPQPDETVDLAPQAVRPTMKLPERQQDPLYFRTEGSAAKFVAAVKVFEQAISTSMATRLDVDERETRVDERIIFQIAYQPTDHLMLGVPPTVRADRLTISVDGQPLLPTSPRERLDGDAEVVPMRLTLPAPRIGRCEVHVSYAVRHEKPPGTASTPLVVPLVIPAEGQLSANELVVVPKADISLRYLPGPWNEDTRNRPSAKTPELALSARRAIADVTLGFSSAERPAGSVTTIERAWIQTRLTDAQRQDRAVYLLATGEQRLQISLPAGADVASLELEIDARRVVPEAIRQRDVTIELPAPLGREHLLEIRYHTSGRESPGQVALACPQIKSAQWVRQLYWQVVLPATEHLVFAPNHFTAEYGWEWSGFFWHRRPSMDQRDLETWSGAVTDNKLEVAGGDGQEPSAARYRAAGTKSTNQYLFSTVGTLEPLSIYTLGRARLVLWASLPLLIGGLLLIYVPAARHPAVLFALAVAVAAGAFIDPDLALLVAQASSLGVVLAAVAALLARGAPRPALPITVVVRGSSQALVERGQTEMYQRAPSGGVPASTATNPLVPTSPEPES